MNLSRMGRVFEMFPDLGEDVAVGVSYPVGGAHAFMRGDRVYRAASLIKVPLVIAVYDAVERGEVDLDEEMAYTEEDLTGYETGKGMVDSAEIGARFAVHDIIESVLTKSDNAGTNMLVRRVGKQRVNDIIGDYGLDGTALRRKIGERYANEEGVRMETGNVTTARDAAQVLELLYRRDIIPGHAGEMIETMKRCVIKTKIPAGLPEGIEVAHKGGSLKSNDYRKAVLHDSAIVFLPQRKYVLAILTEGAEPHRDEPALVDISRRVFACFAED